MYNGVLVGAGHLLGNAWTRIGEDSDYINGAVYAAIAVSLGVFVRRRLRARHSS